MRLLVENKKFDKDHEHKKKTNNISTINKEFYMIQLWSYNNGYKEIIRD